MAREDTRTMKAIAVLTMLFLPATFVCVSFPLLFCPFTCCPGDGQGLSLTDLSCDGHLRLACQPRKRAHGRRDGREPRDTCAFVVDFLPAVWWTDCRGVVCLCPTWHRPGSLSMGLDSRRAAGGKNEG